MQSQRHGSTSSYLTIMSNALVTCNIFALQIQEANRSMWRKWEIWKHWILNRMPSSNPSPQGSGSSMKDCENQRDERHHGNKVSRTAAYMYVQILRDCVAFKGSCPGKNQSGSQNWVEEQAHPVQLIKNLTTVVILYQSQI